MRTAIFIYWTALFSIIAADGALAQTASHESSYSHTISNNSNGNLSVSAAEQKAAAAESFHFDGYSHSSAKGKTIFAQVGENGNASFAYREPEKANYVRVIELANIVFNPGQTESQSQISSRILIGLNSPSYGFKKNLSFAGNFDLKVENIILGITNSGKMTISYDLRKSLKGKDTSFIVAVTKIYFQIGIPFGK